MQQNLFQKLTVYSLVKKRFTFVASAGSLPCSQQPTTILNLLFSKLLAIKTVHPPLSMP